jgi:predicted MFS family arabinose efflux permease
MTELSECPGYPAAKITIYDREHNTARCSCLPVIVSPQWRTTTSAIMTIGLALGWASTAAVGGYLIAGVGFGSLFFVSAALALIAAVLLFGYMRARVKRLKASATM